MSGIKRSGGERFNRYTESKYTNWSQYNPFDLEISSLPEYLKPKDSIEIESGLISIFVRNLHPEFIYPVSLEDIKEFLDKISPNFLKGLRSVYLLGGTSKQLKASKRSFRYGCYESGTIYLYAFPQRMLKENWEKRPKPTTVEEYERVGAKWIQNDSGWWLEFDSTSLRRFYLYDVLLHEIGHHVDKQVWKRDTASAERYAEWFAQEYARMI